MSVRIAHRRQEQPITHPISSTHTMLRTAHAINCDKRHTTTSKNILSTNLSSSPNSKRPTHHSTSSNPSTSSLSIDRPSSATTSSNSRARKSRISSSRAPNTKIDSLIVDLVDTRDLDALGDGVAFAALDFDLGA
jgi:hypothetical protein